MFFVYVLKSENFAKYYTGHTEDIKKRIVEHNQGKTKSIKAFIPYKLIYFEVFETREEAVKREKFLKTGAGRAYIKKHAPVVQLDRIPDFGSGG